MQTPTSKNDKMLLHSSEEEVFNAILDSAHPFRKLNQIIDFSELTEPLRETYSDLGQSGIDVEKGFKTLLIQFWEDYSDRQMEKAVKENMAIRWFCGFGLTENTPDHTYFCKLRKRIGAKKMADMFNRVNKILENHGLFGNVFTFIDASAIVSKTALWTERDQAIQDGEEKLNNTNVKKYASDKDARWGAKGKNKYWFGYKRHCAVDMRHGLINKLSVTPANVLDYGALENVCPKGGMIFMDKLYDVKKSYECLRKNHCHDGIIKKKNNKKKNKDLDRWISKMRMPFEGTFSKVRKRAKYQGQTKVLFQCFAEAICHNLKKAIGTVPIPIGA